MRHITVVLLLGACLGASACGGSTTHSAAVAPNAERMAAPTDDHARHQHAPDPTAQSAVAAAATDTLELGEAIERVRRATAAFHTIAEAVKAGYAETVARCISHPRAGAMGFHHANRELFDDRVEPERPEILLYSSEPDGRYVLNGVEYIVPYSARPPDAEPPLVFGQPLRRSDELRLWYLHVWIWRDNPAGMFADWNPLVSCSAGAALPDRRLPRGLAAGVSGVSHRGLAERA